MGKVITHKTIFYRIFGLIIFILSVQNIGAVRSIDEVIKMQQPDSTVISVRLYGDEFFHYYTTEDNYVIVQNDSSVFVYADYDAYNRIIPGTVKASDVSDRTEEEIRFLRTIQPGLPIEVEYTAEQRIQRTRALNAGAAETTFPTTGKVKTLVILVNFRDRKFTTSQPRQAFLDLLNKENYNLNGATGSARDYYLDNSMGKFDVNFDVVGPVELSRTMDFYGNDGSGNNKDLNVSEMIKEACQLASRAGTDFSQYDLDNDGVIDNVFVIYAGYDQAQGGPKETIWSHRGVHLNPIVEVNGKKLYTYACTSELYSNTGYRIAGIGTFCHEFGHVLGLPDFYHTTNSTSVVERYFLMDSGNYNNRSMTPPYFTAIERFICGWLDIPLLAADLKEVTLESVGKNVAYRINTDKEGEFFVLEARVPVGWDNTQNLGYNGYGLLIYHVDRSAEQIVKWGMELGVKDANTLNNNPSHRCCYIKEATSRIWTFQQKTKTEFSSTSVPAAKSWSGEPLAVAVKNITLDGKQVKFATGKDVNIASGYMETSRVYVDNGQIVILNLPVSESKVQIYGLNGSFCGEWIADGTDLRIPFPSSLNVCILRITSDGKSVSHTLIRQ